MCGQFSEPKPIRIMGEGDTCRAADKGLQGDVMLTLETSVGSGFVRWILRINSRDSEKHEGVHTAERPFHEPLTAC